RPAPRAGRSNRSSGGPLRGGAGPLPPSASWARALPRPSGPGREPAVQPPQARGVVEVCTVVEIGAVHQLHDLALGTEQVAGADLGVGGCGGRGGPAGGEQHRMYSAQPVGARAMRGGGDLFGTMGGDHPGDLLGAQARPVHRADQHVVAGADGLQAEAQRPAHARAPFGVATDPNPRGTGEHAVDLVGAGAGDHGDHRAAAAQKRIHPVFDQGGAPGVHQCLGAQAEAGAGPCGEDQADRGTSGGAGIGGGGVASGVAHRGRKGSPKTGRSRTLTPVARRAGLPRSPAAPTLPISPMLRAPRGPAWGSSSSSQWASISRMSAFTGTWYSARSWLTPRPNLGSSSPFSCSAIPTPMVIP